MAKSTASTTESFDNVEFPSFDASKATEQLRDFAEKGVEQSKEVFAKFKDNAEQAQKAFEGAFEGVKDATSELSLKTISAWRSNAESVFAHLESLVGAKSVSELVELQSAFVKKSLETGVEQAKDFGAAAQKAVEKAAEPVKEAFEKATKDLKAA